LDSKRLLRLIVLGAFGLMGLALVSGFLPTYSLDIALGQYDSVDDEEEGSINRPIDEADVANGCVLGDTEPVADAVFAAQGTRIVFPGVQSIYFAPRLSAEIGLTVGPGEEFPGVCYNSNFTWALININGQGAWVPI